MTGLWRQVVARQRAGRGRGGFTLVEVMISLALLATIMAIVFGAMSQSFKLRDLANLKFDRLRAVQAALRRIEREISMAFVTKIGVFPTNERGEQTYFTAFIGTDDRLDFSNFAHTRTRVGEAASEQAEISYFLRSARTDDGRLRQDLVRREQAPIDGEPEEGGTIYTLLEDVTDIQFEYWEPGREIAGESWQRNWDSRDTGVYGLPPRVRVTVTIPHPIRDDERLTFSIQAEIPLTQPIGFATNVIDPEADVYRDGELQEGQDQGEEGQDESGDGESEGDDRGEEEP